VGTACSVGDTAKIEAGKRYVWDDQTGAISCYDEEKRGGPRACFSK